MGHRSARRRQLPNVRRRIHLCSCLTLNWSTTTAGWPGAVNPCAIAAEKYVHLPDRKTYGVRQAKIASNRNLNKFRLGGSIPPTCRYPRAIHRKLGGCRALELRHMVSSELQRRQAL